MSKFKIQDLTPKTDQSLKDIPRKQKQRAIKPLAYFEKKDSNRKVAMAKAYLSGHYTLSNVGEYFDVSYATVSRAVKSYEGGL
ncbi:MAG: hypothetical protein HND53_02855 [Proteobacteria bacterium]|nr:hypothetical protein [Pseudomonadota bacterium]NOG59413.1 hypothetical protein [Pseudomonadota bacterium]